MQNESKTGLKKNFKLQKRADNIEASKNCIVAVTNIKGKKFDIFHKRKRLNVFFFLPMDSIVDSSAHRSIILTLIARFPFTELVEYIVIKAMETSNFWHSGRTPGGENYTDAEICLENYKSSETYLENYKGAETDLQNYKGSETNSENYTGAMADLETIRALRYT